MKTTIFIALSLLISIFSQAQTGSSAPGNFAVKGSIKGKVQENKNKSALEYANIAVYSLPDSSLVSGTVTNVEGGFEIKNIPSGKYYVIADFIGYNKRIISNIEISIKNRNHDCGIITLEESSVGIDEVNVTAEKDFIQYKIDKKIVNVDKKLSAKGGTVVDALENTPSIQVDAEGNVSLRGSSDFKVLIDGKPTAMASNDALKQIPASAVQNVEIITNPSVKYDPDGTSGIINIIMKKEYKTGLNGLINASVGSNWSHSGDFNLNYRADKVNYFVSGKYSARKMFPVIEIYNETLFDNNPLDQDTLRIVNQTADREQGHTSYSLKGGADFYLNPKTTLTLSGEYGYWGFGMEMPANVHESTNRNTQDVYMVNASELSIGGNYTNANLSYEQKFDESGKHKLEASLNYSNWDGRNETEVDEKTTDFNWINIVSSERNRTIQNTDNYEIRTKLDYTLPVGEKTFMEMGYQSRFKILESDFGKEDYNESSTDWIDDLNFSTGMDFHRYIHSLYFSVAGNVIGLDYKAGIRGEFTDRLLESTTTDDKYKLERFDFFPSLHLSKKIGKQQELQASYSRRINRPQEWHLNPFPIYSDSYISQAGNPDLLPEYVDSYEMNFMQRLKKGFVSMEAYYRQTNNARERTISKAEDSDLLIVSSANLDKNFAYGAELSSNLNLAKWLSVYASANLYSFNVSGEIVSENIETQSLNSDFVLNSTFIMNKIGARLQVTGFYNAPRITSQGKRGEMYGVNLAINKSFLKKKLNVSFRVRDVLQTMKFNFTAQTPGVYTNFNFNMDSPTYTLNVSYRINNYKKRKEEEGVDNNMGGGIM